MQCKHGGQAQTLRDASPPQDFAGKVLLEFEKIEWQDQGIMKDEKN